MSLGLRIEGLWGSPLADAAVTRFERSWTDDLVRRRTPDPGPDRREAYWALKSELKRAWSLGDLKTVAGLGLILHRARTLNDGGREQLAEVLLSQGRFAEAQEALAASAQDDAHWVLTARALAGLQAFGEARDAIHRAADRLEPTPADQANAVIRDLGMRRTLLDRALGSLEARGESRQHIEAGRPDLAAARLTAFFTDRLELFGRLLDLLAQGPASRRGWDELRDEVAGLLILGLPGRAADSFTAGLGEAPPSSADDVASAVYLANAVAANAPGERQAGLLRAVGGLFGPEAEGGFVDLAARVIEGQAPWTELTAAEPSPRADVQVLAATALAQAGRPEPAVALLGRFVLEHAERQAIRRELVVCSGMETLGRLRLEPRPRAGPRQIIDVFPYNGEIEILKLKLHEMGPWVDRFVILEARQTYTGLPKPIFLPGQSAEIAEHLPKITHLITSDPPAHAASAWAREYHQRDACLTALQGLCAPDDLVLLSDTDEIVDRRCLEGFEGEFAVLKKAQHRYFFNYRWAAATWRQSGNLIAMRARYLAEISCSVARALLPAPLGPNRLEQAGWHFTSIGEPAAVARKLASYSHQENVRTDAEDHLAGLMARIRAGDLQPGWERCELDELPAYIRDNRERLADLIL